MGYDYDNADCYTATEFYQRYSSQGKSFVYIYVTSTRGSEGYIDNPERYFKNVTVRTASYMLPVKPNMERYWTNDWHDHVDSGYWVKENHYVKESEDIIEGFTYYKGTTGIYCNSSTGTGSVTTGDVTWTNNTNISVVGSFQRLRDSNGEVYYVASLGSVYVEDSQGNITKRWEDIDNGGSGRGADTHTWTNYSVDITLLDLRMNREVPYIFDVTIPTTRAWKKDEDIEWTEGNPNLLETQIPYNYQNRALGNWYMNYNDRLRNELIPATLSWGQPYPYGKWYRDSDGTLKTRGLPDTLVDTQGAFSGVETLTEVYIPETVQRIGRYSFYGTSLTEVELPEECTYYSTSFPPGCNVIGGRLIN